MFQSERRATGAPACPSVSRPWLAPLLAGLLMVAGAACARAQEGSAASQAAQDEAERTFKVQIGLGAFPTIDYRDAKGNALTFAQFQALSGKGSAFSLNKDKATGVAVLALSDKPVRRTPFTFKIAAGSAFPEFHLSTQDGRGIDKLALHGSYTLLNFYFADCPPCVAEIPQLNAIAQRHAALKVLGVTYDDQADTDKFVAATGFTWPVLAKARSLLEAVGVPAYPSFALIDPDGVLVGVGQQSDINNSDHSLEQWIERLLPAPRKP